MRYLLLAPLLLVLGGCAMSAASKTPTHHSAPSLSRGALFGDVPLRLDVASLRRRGRTAALEFRLINRAPLGGNTFDIEDTFSRAGDWDLGGVSLLDPSTGRELAPLAGDSVDLSSVEIAPGGSQTLSVSFPAPRGQMADVLVPHFGLFQDIPVR
jgi:hypothetical protein